MGLEATGELVVGLSAMGGVKSCGADDRRASVRAPDKRWAPPADPMLGHRDTRKAVGGGEHRPAERQRHREPAVAATGKEPVGGGAGRRTIIIVKPRGVGIVLSVPDPGSPGTSGGPVNRQCTS